ncbi:MAG: twin-arginine translocase TatA/TatE family subunit [Atopobiaceae bacterium]|nr:twin-arginine translocase TatA/TatE family subunit [Atopobiaceae bacterium]MCH4119437.1 twin-arginine translocase TatA/TatE family subunit [Atopobiaceae bacterium]MCI1318538.1 twin-arginine translocase TatA/TatE family subunit [Atopobiaceae bacterium]MCI1389024.1 twin-arginine translocase TatA/TatE family subunit [Atopobiaceae bacterium]MCI1431742.1 twin-arginine translocase TatA/TatE family subunit [Atopobiaceae bacterium]
MFGIGSNELFLILLFGFLLFGPDKLPGVGRTVGRAIRQFREAEEGFTKVVQTEVVDPMNEAAGQTIAKVSNGTASSSAAKQAVPSAAGAAAVDEHAGESFAERKARMEAERTAAKAKKVDKPDEPSDDVDSDEDIKPVKQVSAMPEPKETTSAKAASGLAALYGLSDDDPTEPAASESAGAGASTGEGEGA